MCARLQRITLVRSFALMSEPRNFRKQWHWIDCNMETTSHNSLPLPHLLNHLHCRSERGGSSTPKVVATIKLTNPYSPGCRIKLPVARNLLRAATRFFMRSGWMASTMGVERTDFSMPGLESIFTSCHVFWTHAWLT